jgi:hypothetical protein
VFEKDLRNSLVYFDYNRAVGVIKKICKAELKKHYQVTDIEDALYWELNGKIIDFEDNNTDDKIAVKGSGIWVEIYPVT